MSVRFSLGDFLKGRTPWPPRGLRAALALGGLAAIAGTALVFQPPIAVAQVKAAVSDVEPLTAGGPPQMRRLTEPQYRNAIRAAFGPEIAVKGRFEPDQRVDGMAALGASRAAVSPAGFEQYFAMATDIADQVTRDERRGSIGCAPANPTRFDAACAQRFLSQTGMKLFRRPLTRSELALAMGSARDGTDKLGDFYGGLRLGLIPLLTSPAFLFHTERIESDPAQSGRYRLDAYSKATKLSFLLTDGPPDERLLALAANGELHRPEVLRAEADRLINSDAFERGVRAFFRDLLGFDGFASLTKDANQFPTFDRQTMDDAQEQTLRVIVDQLVTKNGDYGGLFTRTDTYMTRRLGWIYRTPVVTRDGWEQQAETQTFGRTGLLTDISFLALHSHAGRSSPTLRGKFIREAFLCQRVPAPPPNLDFTIVEQANDMARPTARERLTAHQTNESCAGCHRLMDPIGLALEHYDAQGARRERENGAVIDASGDLDGRPFADAQGLGQAMATSPRAKACIVSQVFRYGSGRLATPDERALLAFYTTRFERDGYRFKDLVRTIATSDAFYRVKPDVPAPPPTKIAEKSHNGRTL